MKKLTYIFVTFLFFLSFFVQGQTIQNVVEKLDNYNLANPQEKLYLQLDKYAYTAGETIWFKAYATVGISNLFSNLSGIAYVELINAAEQKVDSLIIPLGLGIGLGDIAISDTITEGSYRLRAYTNWMRNFSDKYFYDRTIQISNGRSDNVITSTLFKEGDKNNVYSVNLKGINGLPLSNTSVRYEIINQGKIVERKRGITDAQGTLNIDIAKKYNNAQISLHFLNVEKVTVNKLIKVINTESLNHVELLPEGGKLLAGFINTVGVKSINNQGLGQKVKIIFTNGKDTLGNTSTNELGMGAFSFFLGPTDSLYAFAVLENGHKQAINTPKIYKSGYSLQVNNQRDNKLYAQVNVSSDLLTGEDIYFLVHHLGKVLFVSKQKISKQELSFSVDKQELPSGVITISILNSRFEPITERPVFSFNKADLLRLDVDLNKQVFGHREMVNVGLNILENDSLKVAALSASVINLSKIKDNPYTAPNILSTLLLSSDLNGYIEKPGYYFEKNELKSNDIEYLMLTQGWRNIDWKTLDVQKKPIFSAEKALSISGYTKKYGRTKPEQGASVQMISTKNFMDFVDTTSNDDGYFNFDNLLFADSIKFLISAKDAKGKNNIDIVYERPVKPGISFNRNWSEEKWDINKLYAEELDFSKKYFSELEKGGLKEKAIQIEEVVVRANQKPKVSKSSRNLNGPGRADQIITAEELSTCVTLEMCLAGRLTGVTWQGGKPYNTRGNVPMQVVLDGMFIEPDQISMVNVIDVESIEVLRNINYTAIYGSNGAGGLIVITSKTGESAMRSYTPKGIITIEPQGAYVNKEFYKPKYDVSNTMKNLLDLRTTIHWEPSIVTNPEGKASFNFYTADEKGKYLLVIEGLDFYGRICREVKEIEIK